MKIITLLPVKNEAWILPYTLKNFSDFSDHIIVADQNSNDNTLEICKQFSKVKVIKNNHTEHSNKIRWDLLKMAREIEGDNNLIICLDADEMISPEFINEIKNSDITDSVAFNSSWLQLYKHTSQYRTDGVWKKSSKLFCFIDDRKTNYIENEVINDHTARIPFIAKIIDLTFPILHFQYLAEKRSEIKQAWYMCKELIERRTPRKINLKYSVAKIKQAIKTETLENDWARGVNFPSADTFTTHNIHQIHEISLMFETHGSKYFEELDIWHIKELKDLFIKENGRIPKIKVFPNWLIALNNIKNKIKSKFL